MNGTRNLLHRWPALAGAVVAFLAASGASGADLAPVVLVIAVIYVMAAVTRRPWTPWVGVALLFVIIPALRILAEHRPGAERAALLGGTLFFVAVGAVVALRRKDREPALQTGALVAFGAAAVGATYLAPDGAMVLLGVALLGHGAWDALHFVRREVVAREFAEFCLVLDAIAGVALIAVALT